MMHQSELIQAMCKSSKKLRTIKFDFFLNPAIAFIHPDSSLTLADLLSGLMSNEFMHFGMRFCIENGSDRMISN